MGSGVIALVCLQIIFNMQRKGEEEEESVGRRNNNDDCFSMLFFAAALPEIHEGI
jgi:hypothetical protein